MTLHLSYRSALLRMQALRREDAFLSQGFVVPGLCALTFLNLKK